MLVVHPLPQAHRAVRWVQAVWEWEGYRSSAAMERILPHGAVEVTWNLAGPHRFRAGSATHAVARAAFVGARDSHYGIETRAQAHLFGIVFQPGAAARLLGVSMDELYAAFEPLSAFRLGQELENRVGEARSAPERFAAVLHFFGTLPCLPNAREALYLLRAWSTRSGRARSVASIREELRLSSPTFVQRIREQLGFRPAQQRQLLMFREAVLALAGGASSPLRIAHGIGFCDQAHLTRTFRTLAGFTPSRFRPLLAEHPFNVAEESAASHTAFSFDPSPSPAGPSE